MRHTAEVLMLLGAGDLGGAYVLRMAVGRDLQVRFGRFQAGRPVAVPAGVCAYVGSAVGSEGALGRRLVRHATRSKRAPQGIRDAMVAAFGVQALPRGEKRRHWHVDFLLDRREVRLTHAIVLRSDRRMEDAIAGVLLEDARTQVIAPGLGAADAPGRTHLLRVPEEMDWWEDLAERLG